MAYRSIKTLIPSPAIIGRIKIGVLGEKRVAKSGNTYQLPQKLDHFLVTKMDRDPTSGNFVPDQEVMNLIGDRCTDLDIMLVDDDIETVFPHSLSYYAGKKCLCRGNGEEAERREHLLKLYGPENHPGPMVPEREAQGLKEKLQAGDYGAWAKTVCPPETCRFFNVRDENKARCKALGRLYMTLPRYKPVLGGTFLFATTSAESIRSIVYTLQELQARTGGILEGIPLNLRLYPKTDETERGQMTSYKVALVFDPAEKRFDLALADHAKTVASIRAASLADLRALREMQRKALVAADEEFVQEIATDPAPEIQENGRAEGFFDAPPTEGAPGVPQGTSGEQLLVPF